MARNFIDGTEHLLTDSPSISGYPFSVSVWFRSDDANHDVGLWFGGDKDNNFDWFGLLWLNGTTNKVQAYSKEGGGSSNAASTGTWSANVWHHAMGRWASTSSRKVNLDGDTTVEETTTRSPSNWDRIALGSLLDSTPSDYMSGDIGVCCVWNVELNDDEVAYLALGGDPRHIRPANIVHYWRLEGLDSPEPDWTSNAKGLTLSGTPTRSDNPPIMPFTPPWAANSPLMRWPLVEDSLTRRR